MHTIQQRVVGASHVDLTRTVLHPNALRHAIAQLARDVERPPLFAVLRAHADRNCQRDEREVSESHGASLPTVTGRRAATTPVMGVGVCHDASSTGRLPLATRRCVPARDRIAAPSPSVTAAHVAATAAARMTVA